MDAAMHGIRRWPVRAVLIAAALVTQMIPAAPVRADAAEALMALPDQPFIMVTPTPKRPVSVTTQLYDNARRGANLAETFLNPDNVKSGRFGKLRQVPVTGQILAQPLYVADAEIDGKGRHNVLVVATAAGMVYALDADTLAELFHAQLDGDPILVDKSNGNSQVTTCAETYPSFFGVSSTPVIDTRSNTVFVESYNPQLSGQHELHALRIQDGFTSDRKTKIMPPGGEPAIMDNWAQRHRNRAALLLSRGVVYVAFASFICDNPQPYAGWVLGYSTRDLSRVASWETPNPISESGASNQGSSGIWQSGRGLVGADDGSLFLMTGNDSNFLALQDHATETGKFVDLRLANSFVKLSPGGEHGLTMTGSFSPKNSSQLSAGDTDLGSSGPILLPGGRLVGGGKQGRAYVIDTATMLSLQDHMHEEGFEGFQAFFNSYHLKQDTPPGQKTCTAPHDQGNADLYCRILQKTNLLARGSPCTFGGDGMSTGGGQDTPRCFLPVACYQFCQLFGPNIHAGFVYWQHSADGGLLYALPEAEHLKAFAYHVGAGAVDEAPIAETDWRVPEGMPGGALSVSANGMTNGIVWASYPNQDNATNGVHRGTLRALDAIGLAPLWSDECIFFFAKFNPPLVANGHVYLATFADPRELDQRRPPGPTKSDGSCDGKDPVLWPKNDALDYDPEHKLTPGTAWIIEYGVH